MSLNTNEPDPTREQAEIRNPEVTYDATDLSARAVFMFLIFLALAGIILQTSLWAVYKYLASDQFQPHPTTRPIGTSKQELTDVGGDPAVKFPAPRLQPDPVADLNKFRVREEEILNTYGWIDQAHGKAHIPIERAIDLVSQVGLPVRSNTATTAATAPASTRAAAAAVNVKPGGGHAPPNTQ